MTPYRTRIYFEDECPRLGSGWRTVTVEEGRKWSYLTESGSGKRVRISLDLLDRLESSRRMKEAA